MNHPPLNLADLVFYGTAAVTVGCAVFAALTGNIVRAVFSLLGTFFGVAVLYGLLSADFIAVVQLLVYVGGILVLMLFAVMLTSNIESVTRSSRSGGLAVGTLCAVSLLLLLVTLALHAPWKLGPAVESTPTTAAIGDALLHDSLLPFQLVALILVAVVIGAVVVARGRESQEGNE